MSKDRYRYFRLESKEILDGITKGILEIEKGSASEGVLGEVLRLAHTLKGAAGVVKLPEVARMAHAIEDALSVHRGDAGPVPRGTVDPVLRLLDEIGRALAGLDSVLESEACKESVSAKAFETVRIEIEEVNALVEGITEAGIQADALRQTVAEFAVLRQRMVNVLDGYRVAKGRDSRDLSPSIQEKRAYQANRDLRGMINAINHRLTAGIHRVERELKEARNRADRLRLVPASALFAEMERATRDVAESTGKEVVLETSGGDRRIDAHVLSALRVALLHLVRNAVVHGIEDQRIRTALGKPPIGRVSLYVERRGHCVSFECRDDGRGVDLDGVRQAAVDQRIIAPENQAELELEEALRLIFRAGVTTTRSAGMVSGRGVGLDVVRDIAARLKGQVKARSEPGRGMAVEITVPISLTSLETLVVEQGKRRVAIPFAAVRRVVRLSRSDIANLAEGESIIFNEQAVPFSDLVTLVDTGSPRAARNASCSAVIVQADSCLVALGVDRLLGTQNEVIRPVPPMAGDLPLLAGASFDSEGNPNIVLDPQRLLEAMGRRGNSTREHEPVTRPPILVVDDSLTTRMLEQTILEANGYEVDFATSGEEALHRVKQRRYGLLLVDVEMPGMSGFEFLEGARSHPDLQDTPVILVTTRSSPEDRRRGLEAGARAYMVKSEFDEDHFLRTIRGFIG